VSCRGSTPSRSTEISKICSAVAHVERAAHAHGALEAREALLALALERREELAQSRGGHAPDLATCERTIS